MCIKTNNFDHKKLNLDKQQKFETITPVVYHHLTYNYDSYITKRLYILTDWIEIVNFSYKYPKKQLYFAINNNDLIKLFKSIHQHIKFPNNNTQHNNIQLTDDSESETESEDDMPVLKKKTNQKKHVSESETESEEEFEPKKPFIKSNQINSNQINSNTQNIDYNNLITINNQINQNNINDIDIEEEDDYKNYPLIFKDKSQLKLIPSKKSGKSEYILDKIENYNEIDRYFPTINKKNNNFKVVGKFLVYITVSCYGDNFNGNSFKIYIDSGELKYEKTYVENDILKAKGVYNDMIKLDI